MNRRAPFTSLLLCATFALVSAGAHSALRTLHSDDKDLFDHLVLDPNLKTFTGLIVKAGMVEALKAEGPITLFAPNDAAFAKLPTATLDALKKDRALLRKILSYHLLNGKLLTKDVKDGNLKTQSGDFLAIKVKVGATTTVNGQRMVNPDIETSNGVMHVVGTVMTFPAKPPKSHSLGSNLRQDVLIHPKLESLRSSNNL